MAWRIGVVALVAALASTGPGRGLFHAHSSRANRRPRKRRSAATKTRSAGHARGWVAERGRTDGGVAKRAGWVSFLRPPPTDPENRGTPRHQGGSMKAIVQAAYGSPNVLQLHDIDKPVVGDGGVLVRVQAAGVDPGVWHLTAGLPYLVRLMGLGLRAPKRRVPGMDVAGRVEAVGKNVTRFRPGDEVFGACPKGSLGRVWVSGGAPGAEAGQRDFRAGGGRAGGGLDRLAGPSRQRTDSAGAEGACQWRVGRSGDVRRADCQSVRRGRDRRVRPEEYGPGPVDRRGPRDRLHARELRGRGTALRPHPRQRRPAAAVGPASRPRPQRDPRHRRRGRRRTSGRAASAGRSCGRQWCRSS